MSDITTIISVVTGILLTISETLPFFKDLNANGIIHLLATIGKNKESVEYVQSIEREPLLKDSIEVKLETINDTLSTITNRIYDSLNSVIDNSRVLKLHPSELYELNYIINYIKANYPRKHYSTKCLSKTNKQLLISQGYITDYDSLTDTHMIKW